MVPMQRPHPLALASAACVSAALILDFNHFHLQQTSDSLVPVLASLLHWTPFFWGQAYYGMLLPWLLQPLHSPLLNFLVNNGVCFALGLGVHFAVAAYLLRHRAALWVGGMSASLMVGCTSAHWCFTHISPLMFYPTPMLLGLAALCLLEAPRLRLPRLLACSLLLGLACWVNVSVVLILGVLAVGRHGLQRRLLQRLVPLLGVGALGGRYAMRSTGLPGPDFAPIALDKWPLAVGSAAVDAVHTLRDGFESADLFGLPPLFVVLGGALALGSLWRARQKSRPAADRALRPVFWRTMGLAAGFAVFVSVQHWAEINAYSGRYWYPLFPPLQVLCLAWLALPLDAWAAARGQRLLDWGSTLLLPALCLWMYGIPSSPIFWQDMQRWTGDAGPQVVASRANFVGGDYWKVWPAVFQSNLLLYQAGRPLGVWGMANKGGQQLSAVPPEAFYKARIFVARGGGPYVASMLAGGSTSLQLVQHADAFDLFTLRR
jgi:hypothetical protein